MKTQFILPIQNNKNKYSFKGYDARPLKAIAMTQPGYRCGIARELEKISNEAGFRLEILTDNKLKPLSYIDEIIVPVKRNFRLYYELLLKDYTNKPKESFKVAFHSSREEAKKARGFKFSKNASAWAQDNAVVTPDNKVLTTHSECALACNIGRYHGRAVVKDYDFVKGGNLFFVKSKGQDELFVGRSDRKKFMGEDGKLDYKKLLNMYGVKKITFLPQMDFHLDLAIRPLDKKRVLITDDNLTLKVLQEGIEKFRKAILGEVNQEKKVKYEKILAEIEKLKNNFANQIKNNKYAPIKNTEKILKHKGFKTIRVPGRIYHLMPGEIPNHMANFMNAIVTVNKNKELYYITNKSLIDYKLGITQDVEKEVGFSFENSFKKSIARYVKPENIFFLQGALDEISQSLEKKHGGIHCLTTEIPWNNFNSN